MTKKTSNTSLQKQLVPQLQWPWHQHPLPRRLVASPAATPVAAPGPAPASAPAVVIPAGERELVQPMSTMRRVISENMVASKQTSPHVTTFFDVDYTTIDAVRNVFKNQFKQEEGVSLTYTTFLAYGVTSPETSPVRQCRKFAMVMSSSKKMFT